MDFWLKKYQFQTHSNFLGSVFFRFRFSLRSLRRKTFDQPRLSIWASRWKNWTRIKNGSIQRSNQINDDGKCVTFDSFGSLSSRQLCHGIASMLTLLKLRNCTWSEAVTGTAAVQLYSIEIWKHFTLHHPKRFHIHWIELLCDNFTAALMHQCFHVINIFFLAFLSFCQMSF